MDSPAPSSHGHPQTEVTLPGATTEEVRGWARIVTEANPIASGGRSDQRFPDGAEREITDEPFMGIELTFVAGGRPIHTLTLFATVPNDEERLVMEERGF